MDPGQKIQHYRLIEKIGEGGMGEVFRARDTKLERDVALKIVPADFAADEQRMARFAREAQVLASLNHPHISAIYGLEEQDGVRALVLELVEGEELTERISSGPVSVKEALRIAGQIAEGLESAHAQGVIHRDLKPANVKITPDGVTKVLDFGLAKALGDDASSSPELSRSPTLTVAATQAGLILGTAGYMAPEQARGLAIDRRADIWAFGVVLYEMLTGDRLFGGKTVTDVLAAVIRAEPDLDRLPADASSTVRRLLRRCLAKDPAERMRDFGDVLLELREADQEPPDTPPSAGPSMATPRSPWRQVATWAAGLVLLAAAGAAGFLVRGKPTPPVLHASILPPESTRFHLETSSPGPPVLSPDGRSIAFSARPDEGRVQLHVRRLDAPAAYALSGTEGAGYPFWSPDGKSLGFFVRDEGKLKRIDATGGPAVTIALAHNGKGGVWTSDGRIIFSPSHDQALVSVPDSGGVPTPLTELDRELGDNSHRHPWLMPDERHVLFLARGRRVEVSGPGAILAVPVEGGEPQFVMASRYGVTHAAGHILYIQQGLLMAQPFDASVLQPDGDPFPVAQDVKTIDGAAKGVFTVAGEDVLAFLKGASTGGRVLRWISPAGVPGDTLGDESEYSEVVFSSDGRQLAATTSTSGQDSSDLWIYDVERGVRSRFTFSDENENSAAWSPDSKRIYFGAERNGVSQIYVKPVGGTDPERLVFESEVSKFPRDVSPDGRYLAYAVTENAWDLHALELTQEEAEPFLVVGGETRQSDGVFSPDGRWFAFTSTESGRSEVYVIPFPDADRKWQISTEGGQHPKWDPRGGGLYYQGLLGAISRVDIEARQDSILVGLPEVLFRRPLTGLPRRWAPTPDGTRFLVVEDKSEEKSTPLEIVLNWFPDTTR